MFELQGCQKSDDTLRCTLLITNMGDSDRALRINANYPYGTQSRVISASGEEFIAEQVQFGQDRNNYVEKQMIRGVPVKAVLSFKVSSKVSSLAVLEVGYGFYNPDRVNKTIQFRNIAIQSR